MLDCSEIMGKSAKIGLAPNLENRQPPLRRGKEETMKGRLVLFAVFMGLMFVTLPAHAHHEKDGDKAIKTATVDKVEVAIGKFFVKPVKFVKKQTGDARTAKTKQAKLAKSAYYGCSCDDDWCQFCCSADARYGGANGCYASARQCRSEDKNCMVCEPHEFCSGDRTSP